MYSIYSVREIVKENTNFRQEKERESNKYIVHWQILVYYV